MIDPVFQTASKKLAIAHVHTGLVGSGGDRVSELEAHYLVSRGHQVTVVGLTAPDTAARLAAHGIAIVNEPAEIRSVEAILARTGGFDIVHCHCILSAPFAASLAKSSGAVFVIHSHSMGESWWESTSIISRLLSRRQGLRREIDHAFASADLILCVSEAVLGHLRAIGLPTEQAIIMRNPIDEIFFRKDVATGRPYHVAILARPSRAKSPVTALRILAEASRFHPGIRMIWIGPLGRWEPIMRSLISLLRLRGLKLAGNLAPAQVCDILDVTRVLLSASNREGQPLSVLEALSRQCSAMLSDIPAHRPFAQDAGVQLFTAGDTARAGRALTQLIESHLRQPRPQLACHRMDAHGSKLLVLYEILVRQRRSRLSLG